MDLTLPVFALSRLRMGTDGRGVTTLVCAAGCPLRCKYCLNPQSWRPGTRVRVMTPRALYDAVNKDDLYFRATGGGVTFGGGEPLMHAAFIAAFRDLCGEDWHITVETCLNVPREKLSAAMGCVDEFVVDIKDVRPEIYRRYTGADNGRMLRNLSELVSTVGPERVRVRVPRIPGYNAPEDVERSAAWLRSTGVLRLEPFTYIVRRDPMQERVVPPNSDPGGNVFLGV